MIPTTSQDDEFKVIQESMPLDVAFKQCDLHLLCIHDVVYPSKLDWEYSLEEIISHDKVFLQKNTIYCICQVAPNTLRSTMRTIPTLNKLRLKMDVNDRCFTSAIQVNLEENKEIYRFPVSVRQDIVFVAPLGDVCGWYNIRANILWLSDVVHHKAHSVGLLTNILKEVQELRKNGYVSSSQKPLMIGADPEFEIIREDGYVPASKILKFDGQVGTDGYADVGELRPTAHRSPLGLANNIRRLLRQLIAGGVLPVGSQIHAGGGNKLSTGGHIHFSIPTISNQSRQMLHHLVGDVVIPTQGEYRTQKSPQIWKINGTDTIRSNEHGFEWRSLPSWITSPDVCESVLATTYSVIHALQFGQLTQRRNLPREVILRSLPYYSIYKDQIEKFICLFVVNPKIETLAGVDVAKEWGIKPKYNNQNIQPNVTVSTYDPDLQDLFPSVYVPTFRHSVRIRLTMVENSTLTVSGYCTPSLQHKFMDLASKKMWEWKKNLTESRRLLAITFPITPTHEIITFMPLIKEFVIVNGMTNPNSNEIFNEGR